MNWQTMMSKVVKTSLPLCRKLAVPTCLPYCKPNINMIKLNENQKNIDSIMFRTLCSINVKHRVTNKRICMSPTYYTSNLRTSSLLSSSGKFINISHIKITKMSKEKNP